MPKPDLHHLLSHLNPAAGAADRHAWLRAWMEWVRGPDAVERVLLFLEAVQARADRAEAAREWLLRLLDEGDLTTLLADLGFAPRTALLSEISQRLKWHTLPLSPDTTDMAEVFRYLEPTDADAQWLAALASDERIWHAWSACWSVDGTDCRERLVPRWQAALEEALICCASQIAATGFASEIRQRLSNEARAQQPFEALLVQLQRAIQEKSPEARRDLLKQLEACRQAAYTVYTHLEQHGISVGIVFRLRQLRRRVIRTRLLIEALDHPGPASVLGLLSHLAQEAHDTRSIRSLLQATTGLLAERVTERNAASGEHYITRNWTEYRQMFKAALGGGSVLGLTTWAKFALAGLAMSPFWAGLAVGLNYAASFVLIMLLHWTVATKQPAVTAPAMALKLKQIQDASQIEGFVDEVAHLFRSQVAAILGNVLAVIPAVLLLNALLHVGHHVAGLGWADRMIDPNKAQAVIQAHHFLGPTALYAALTGVLLFASSLIAGSVENWFVFNRMASAIHYHRGLRRMLGPERSARMGRWLQAHISSLAANVSLGLLLGLVPVFAQFMGAPLEVRHVTLASGQLAAAACALGMAALMEPAFWCAVVGVAIVGPLNLGVSFYLAFRVALASQAVSVLDRRRLGQALWSRLRQAPGSFLRPPPDQAISASDGQAK